MKPNKYLDEFREWVNKADQRVWDAANKRAEPKKQKKKVEDKIKTLGD